MSILAVALFGSCARGDQITGSDTDLLMVAAEGETPWHSCLGNVSLSYYPYKDLAARAERGDLFLCHILREGRALYDPDRIFDGLRTAFQLRSSYNREIAQAAALGWLLVRFGRNFLAHPVAARRAAWVVRTILIARSAEAGEPRFAAKALADLAPIPETGRLIWQKNGEGLTPRSVRDLRRFLTWAHLPDPSGALTKPEDNRQQFEATDNAVGLHFLDSLQARANHETYS